MSDEALQELDAACDRVTESNCGWQDYQAARAIHRDIRAEIYRRTKIVQESRRG